MVVDPASSFTVVRCEDDCGTPHLAAVLGDVTVRSGVLVRVHHECLPGDLFVSTCACRRRMQRALSRITQAGAGVLLYVRGGGSCGELRSRGPADARALDATVAAALGRLGVQAAHLLTDEDDPPAPACSPNTALVPLRETPGPALTPREGEVLALVAQGLLTKQIARRLAISERTASHHIEHIYAKLGVSTRAAAAAYAVEHGLAEQPALLARPHAG